MEHITYEQVKELVSQWQPNTLIYGVNRNSFFIAMQAESPLFVEGDTMFLFACYNRVFGKIYERGQIKLADGGELAIPIYQRINSYNGGLARCQIMPISDFDFDDWKPKEKE